MCSGWYLCRVMSLCHVFDHSKIGSKVILAGAKMETSLPQIPLQNAATHGQSKQKQIDQLTVSFVNIYIIFDNKY